MTEATRATLLVVDDDPVITKIVADRFRVLGYRVLTAASGQAALGSIDEHHPDLVLLDLQMPGLDGFGVLEELKSRADAPPTVVITAHGSIQAAVRAVQAGAQDFIAKPFDAAHLEHVVESVLERAGMRRRLDTLEHELSSRHSLVLGSSRAMRETFDIAMRAAASDATVLLVGESGTGKEVLARAIHRASKRASGPFIAVNCATLGSELLESELFGHERGAFTGAIKAKPGKVELARSGTLFLDEIGEVASGLQAKLLRVLQEREIERVGGTKPMAVDVRVIAATNRDLSGEIAARRFREDLYYRLNVVSLRMPPLRDRKQDIDALLEHFLKRFSADAGHRELRWSVDAKRLLANHNWPGNVRELANVVERAVVLAQSDEIGVEDLPEEIVEASTAPPRASTHTPPSYGEAVAEAKRAIIRDALQRTDGHQTRAAELLGMRQPYLARLMKNLGMRDERGGAGGDS
ncbi:MAG TPA: sigma-54 dependent transcriptional regulator [Polyangiaceae bacterium]|nr:sigma-54 dependent transcriptional regulator [Polyangiaceae bacterium]